MRKWFLCSVVIAMSILLYACSGSPDISSCSICGTKYQAGDSGGNYMSIARTRMCKRCYNNYKSTKEIVDFYKLNK